jgi:hypothetical protein
MERVESGSTVDDDTDYEFVSDEREREILTNPDVQAGFAIAYDILEKWKKSLDDLPDRVIVRLSLIVRKMVSGFGQV